MPLPSGFRLKAPRLVPLPERSECREVLLAEWGAPGRKSERQASGWAAVLPAAPGRLCSA